MRKMKIYASSRGVSISILRIVLPIDAIRVVCCVRSALESVAISALNLSRSVPSSAASVVSLTCI